MTPSMVALMVTIWCVAFFGGLAAGWAIGRRFRNCDAGSCVAIEQE